MINLFFHTNILKIICYSQGYRTSAPSPVFCLCNLDSQTFFSIIPMVSPTDPPHWPVGHKQLWWRTKNIVLNISKLAYSCLKPCGCFSSQRQKNIKNIFIENKTWDWNYTPKSEILIHSIQWIHKLEKTATAPVFLPVKSHKNCEDEKTL